MIATTGETVRGSHYVGTKSFHRHLGFTVFTCSGCGDWTSGFPEDLSGIAAEHGAHGAISVEGESDAVAEMKAATMEKLRPFLLRMKVSPPATYTAPKFASFAKAIDGLIRDAGEGGLLGDRKMKFVVGTIPLPGMVVSKSSMKPLERYWPIDYVRPKHFEAGLKLDAKWYEKNVEGYVMSAFGFDTLELAVQRDLSSWF